MTVRTPSSPLVVGLPVSAREANDMTHSAKTLEDFARPSKADSNDTSEATTTDPTCSKLDDGGERRG